MGLYLLQKEKIINEYIETTKMKGVINTTNLTSFSVVKQFDDLIAEVLKVLDNVEGSLLRNKIP
jgi:hypothetical protein